MTRGTDGLGGGNRGLMTVGGLARRTGLSVKVVRRYEAAGLVYSAGRSEGNYRLFDETALLCAQVLSNLRSLGLTVKEIEQLADVHHGQTDEPIGPLLATVLKRVERAHRAAVGRARGAPRPDRRLPKQTRRRA